MGEAARRGVGLEDFYKWAPTQDRKYELVHGEPVLMAGANRRHDRIVANMIRVVGNQLLGRTCQPFTSDTFVRIPAGNARLPDLGVDCGRFDDAALEASEPRLVVEVLSPSTSAFDRIEKLEEYKTVPSLEYILLVDPDQPLARLYRRGAGGHWTSERITGIEAAAAMPSLGLELRLDDIYAGLTFHPRPTLVDPAEPTA